MIINTNISSLIAQGALTRNQASANQSLQRLSTGLRINSARDDAAGLAIANKLESDVRAGQAASRNAAQGLSMLQTADGSAQTISSILDRIKELAAEAASDTVGTDRDKLNTEFASLRTEIGRILDTTTYQGVNVLTGLGTTFAATEGADYSANGLDTVATGGVALTDGVVAGGYTVTVNENADPTKASITLTGTGTAAGHAETVTVTGSGKQQVAFKGLGITLGLNANFDGTAAGALDGSTITVAASSTAKTLLVSASGDYSGNDTIATDVGSLESVRTALTGQALDNLANAQTALTAVDTAIGNANTFLGKVGALSNRLQFAQTNTDTMVQNTLAAESTIKDADMAAEMASYTKANILSQSSIAMIAQANQQPQMVLKLLQ